MIAAADAEGLVDDAADHWEVCLAGFVFAEEAAAAAVAVAQHAAFLLPGLPFLGASSSSCCRFS